MIPVSQYKFYTLGVRLERVVAHKGAVSAADMFTPLMEAQAALDDLIKGDPIQLDYAKADANALLNKLGALFDKFFIDPSSRQFRFPAAGMQIEPHELTLISSFVEKFEAALAAELGRKAVYAVPKRGLFDSLDLAEHADIQFADVDKQLTPQMRQDIKASGRALAFGMPTAACFHMVRALEGALSRYIEGVTGQAAESFHNLWKDGLARLRSADKESDARVVAMLQDVDKRYREPMVAGEEIKQADAQILFSLASSILTLMLESIAPGKGHVQPQYRALQERVEQVSQQHDVQDELGQNNNKRHKSA